MPYPNANGVHAGNLLRLAAKTGEAPMTATGPTAS